VLGGWMYQRRDRQPIKQRALPLVLGGNIMALAMPWSMTVHIPVPFIFSYSLPSFPRLTSSSHL
jgi:hypothetical protein